MPDPNNLTKLQEQAINLFLMRTVEESLKYVAADMEFTLLVYPQGQAAKANVISNSDESVSEDALAIALNRLRNGAFKEGDGRRLDA